MAKSESVSVYQWKKNYKGYFRYTILNIDILYINISINTINIMYFILYSDISEIEIQIQHIQLDSCQVIPIIANLLFELIL